jgi:hypothetical protein
LLLRSDLGLTDYIHTIEKLSVSLCVFRAPLHLIYLLLAFTRVAVMTLGR